MCYPRDVMPSSAMGQIRDSCKNPSMKSEKLVEDQTTGIKPFILFVCLYGRRWWKSLSFEEGLRG